MSVKVNQAKQHFYDYYLICEKLINLLGQCKSSYETLEKTIESKVDEDLCGDIIWSQKRVADYYYEYNMSKVQEYEERLQFAFMIGPYAHIEYSLLLENYRVQAQKWKEVSEMCQGKMDVFDEVECFTANLFVGEVEDGFHEIKNMLESMSTVYQNGGFCVDHNVDWRRTINDLPKCFESVVYAVDTDTNGSLTPEQKEANVEYIYIYLTEKGWSLEAISGLLGNIERESCMNPGMWEKTEEEVTELKKGYGIVQFTPASNFWNYLCQKEGFNVRDSGEEVLNKLAEENPILLLELQLEYIDYTSAYGTDEKRWLLYEDTGAPYKMTYEQYITSTNSCEELALVFMGMYERPEEEYRVPEERMQNARDWYEYLKENVVGE